jgi:hypothetical protein
VSGELIYLSDDVLTRTDVEHSTEMEEALRGAITLHLLKWAGTVVALHHAREDHAGAPRERTAADDLRLAEGNDNVG